MPERTLGYALRIDVDADPLRVWSALTTDVKLARWLSSNARIAAREGGSFRGSVDRESELLAYIDVFAPGRRLRLIHLPSPALPAAETAIVDDLLLEPRGPFTRLRVLGSGFPPVAPWDVLFRRHQAGWRLSLARLKIYLEKNMDGGPSAAEEAAT
ncbi:MAG: SRPBCC domain-containing protein [Gammaproteobacteria bacterium]|nr:SRPBCC domain-containing protein [Gammaproteobacteria bacterium]